MEKALVFFGGGGGWSSKIEVIWARYILYIHYRKQNTCSKELTYPTYIEKGNSSSREGIYFLLEKVLKFYKQVWYRWVCCHITGGKQWSSIKQTRNLATHRLIMWSESHKWWISETKSGEEWGQNHQNLQSFIIIQHQSPFWWGFQWKSVAASWWLKPKLPKVCFRWFSLPKRWFSRFQPLVFRGVPRTSWCLRWRKNVGVVMMASNWTNEASPSVHWCKEHESISTKWPTWMIFTWKDSTK